MNCTKPWKRRSLLASIGALMVQPACSLMPGWVEGSGNVPPEIESARLARHIEKLASDEFEGRMPASRGEALTIEYLVDQFRRLGLKPGHTDGSFLQKVPLASITADPSAELVFTNGSGTTSLRYRDDFMAWTKRVTDRVDVNNSEVVFVGYGTVAPEFNWDDYKGADMRGKTLIMLVNDPPIADPNDQNQLDPEQFGGKAMTYYGRWTYKYEIAAKVGAAACLIIHDTEPAGYPWEVVSGSWGGEQFDLVSADRNMGRAAVEGWLTHDQAEALFSRAGLNLEEMKRAATSRNFRPIPLNTKASITLENRTKTLDSHNVIAKLEGSDPVLRDEYVIYMGHWDHLGKDTSLEGDQIYNGAVDNASGTAGLLVLAEAYANLPTPPRRSVLFLAVTAEEKGLLGSRHYAENPVYPLVKTTAVLNMDVLNVYGRTHDLIIVGLGNSTLDDVAEAVAKTQGRVLKPDAEPEKGFFYRSDHFNFAKEGVPALYPEGGVDYVGRPEGWGLEMRAKYTSDYYHKPADEFDPNWDLSGAVEDLQLLFEVGLRLANQNEYPKWNDGTEFKAKRQQMLRDAGIRKD